jgi:hypothetical protein
MWCGHQRRPLEGRERSRRDSGEDLSDMSRAGSAARLWPSKRSVVVFGRCEFDRTVRIDHVRVAGLRSVSGKNGGTQIEPGECIGQRREQSEVWIAGERAEKNGGSASHPGHDQRRSVVVGEWVMNSLQVEDVPPCELELGDARQVRKVR